MASSSSDDARGLLSQALDSDSGSECWKVRIEKAVNLIDADVISGSGVMYGKSDPYCSCEVIGNPSTRVQTDFLMDTLNPEWNFTARIFIDPDDSFLFQVWDKDWGKPDDFLGKAILRNSQFYPNGFNGELVLETPVRLGCSCLEQKRQDEIALLRVCVYKAAEVSSITGLNIRRGIVNAYRRNAVIHPRSITGMGLRDRFKKVAHQMKIATEQKTKSVVFYLSQPYVKEILVSAGKAVSEYSVADPDMPLGIRKKIKAFVDGMWEDIMTEVLVQVDEAKYSASGSQYHDVMSLAQVGQEPWCCSPRWLRALLLYSYLPYDTSLFGSLRRTLYLLCTALSLLPTVRVYFYAVLLFCFVVPGPPDEFQLVQFILLFKGTQFLSGGVASGFIGGVKYFKCVGDDGLHTCSENGPGMDGNVYLDLNDLLGSCVLVWMAFLLLPISCKSAGLRVEISEIAGTYEEGLKKFRGGRLMGLLIYDLVCFSISCIVLVSLEFYRDAQLGHLSRLASWQFRSALFWARVFYSFLSWPFFIFILPVLQNVLTHTVPTGFNTHGACVPYLLYPMPEGTDTIDVDDLSKATSSREAGPRGKRSNGADDLEAREKALWEREFKKT